MARERLGVYEVGPAFEAVGARVKFSDHGFNEKIGALEVVEFLANREELTGVESWEEERFRSAWHRELARPEFAKLRESGKLTAAECAAIAW
jgi:hypothetical protein